MAKYFVSREKTRRIDQSANHKLNFYDDDKLNKFTHGFIFRSTRSVVLQQLLYLNYLLCSGHSWLCRRLVQRYKDYNKHNRVAIRNAGFEIVTDEKTGEKIEIARHLYPCHLVKFLGYQDIMDVLGCSRRTAAEYATVLKEIHDEYELALS